jgi:hypothetical protein
MGVWGVGAVLKAGRYSQPESGREVKGKEGKNGERRSKGKVRIVREVKGREGKNREREEVKGR